jgi:hypothetical protein
VAAIWDWSESLKVRLLQVNHLMMQLMHEESLRYQSAQMSDYVDAILARRACLLSESLVERVAGGAVCSPVLLPAELLLELECLG